MKRVTRVVATVSSTPSPPSFGTKADSSLAPLVPLAPAREVELKLHVPIEGLRRLADLSIVKAMVSGKVERLHLITTYFDTPDLLLAGRGVALRLRLNGDQAIQGIKSINRREGDTVGVAIRREWEWPVPQAMLDLDSLRDPRLAEIVPPHILDQLLPILITDIQRTTMMLSPEPGRMIEMALDQGVIIARPAKGPERRRKVSEVELELRNGRAADLFAMAATLHKRVALRIAMESKVDIGFAMLSDTPLPVRTAPPTGLTPATTLGEAYRHSVRNALSQLLGNETVLRETHALGALREMSAALRRLDAAFRLFKPIISTEHGQALNHRQRAFTATFATAREWERAADRIITLAEARTGQRPLLAALAGKRRAARLAVRQLLQAPSWTEWVLDLAGWIERGDWVGIAGLDEPVADRAGRLLQGRFEKVVRTAERTRSTGENIDAFTRRIDRLRYDLDFLRGVLPIDKVRPISTSVTNLRARLRSLGDAERAGRFVADWRAAGHKGGKSLEKLLLAEADVLRDGIEGDWAALQAVWVRAGFDLA